VKTPSNFRGFEEAQLGDLRRITLLTGLNGSGKTSILEAAFLIGGAANASLVTSLYSFRGEYQFSPRVDRPFRSLFRNLDAGVFAKNIASTIERTKSPTKTRRRLVIKPTFPVASGQLTPSETQVLNGVSFEFSGPSGKAVSKSGWLDQPRQRPQ
jgi:predicted ATP-dependent endonuclease of OLD family